MKQIKIAVIFGGESSEKEVSSWTAESFIKSLKRLSIAYIKIDLVNKNWLEKIKEENVSFALLAVHGKFGEDGQLQKILEKNKINYSGSNSESSALSWDKLKSQKKVFKAGIISPKTFAFSKNKPTDKVISTFPVIVKPNEEGSSFGVTIVNNPNELKSAINLAMKYDNKALVQEYIWGKEVTCGVIDVFGKVQSLPVVEIKPKTQFFDFKAKYDSAYCQEIVPAKLNKKITNDIKSKSIKIFKLFNCEDYVRIDFIIKDDEPYFLEINTLPGFTNTSLLPKSLKAAGIDFDKFVKQLVYNKTKKLKTSYS